MGFDIILGSDHTLKETAQAKHNSELAQVISVWSGRHTIAGLEWLFQVVTGWNIIIKLATLQIEHCEIVNSLYWTSIY